MVRIGLRLDRAVHLAAANVLVLGVPFAICDGAETLLDAWSGNGSTSRYLVFVIASSLLEVWARAAALAALRGGGLRGALGAPFRRPALLIYGMVACAEPWATPDIFNVVDLLRFLAVSVLIFASFLALVDTVMSGTPPLRALAWWLRQVLRPSRIPRNIAGTAIVWLLSFGPYNVLALLPLSGSPLWNGLWVLPEAFSDAVAIVFALQWYDAVLDERFGRDLERLLDQAETSTSPSATSPGVTTSQ